MGDGTTYCAPATFKQIAPAGGFTCGVGGDGGMYCWGNNSIGQLGIGTFAPHARPVQVGTATDWVAVDARNLKACGLRADHTLWCWGNGENGTLGDGKLMIEPSPTMVISDKTVGWRAFSVGRNRVCGIHDDASLACWGTDGVTGTIANKPVAIGSDQDWMQIAVGTVACGLRNTGGGNLFCFGKSSAGDLGLGATTSQALPARVGTDVWRAVGVGSFNACGVQGNGALFCWGNNQNPGVLQYGTSPTQVGTATDWSSVTISIATIAALRSNGTAYLWGDNSRGGVGISQFGPIAEPTALSGNITAWSSLAAGNAHGCGISAGKAYCWGQAGDGELGEGTVSDLYVPTKMGNDSWMSVVTGQLASCGVRSDSALLCWGFNLTAGLGFGNTDPMPAPTRLGSATWSSVGAANLLSPAGTFCGVLGGGGLACWGDNSTGALGIGSTASPQLTPVAPNVPPATRWSEIATASHTCAIASDGALSCWGANGTGQLGNNAPGPTPVTAPAAALAGTWLHVAVAGSTGVSGAGGVTYAIRTDHTLWSWGRDLSGAEHDVPTQVGSDVDWAAISASQTTACGVKTTGALYCRGQFIGDGTDNTVTVMTPVGAGQAWKTVSCGNEVCAIKTDGSLWCWGNELGTPLGDGSTGVSDPITGNRPATTVPTRIGSDTDWATVSSHGGNSCATRTDGSLWCWGVDATTTPQIKTTPTAID